MARQSKSIVVFPPLARMKQLIEKKKADVIKGHDALARETTQVMRRFIVPKRRGSTGNLAQSIDADVIVKKDGVFVGVGNIQKMFAQAPYWYVANYGSKWPGSLAAVHEGTKGPKFVPPPNLGFFSDGKPNSDKVGIGTAQWGHTGIKGNDLLVPKTFTPINYIENTQGWLKVYWKKYWANALNKK